MSEETKLTENITGRFGEFGGQYIPETLMNEIHKLEKAYEKILCFDNNNTVFCRIFYWVKIQHRIPIQKC